MQGLIDAIDAFLDGITGISWTPLVLAICCHLARIVSRSRAWRNVISAAYPDERVRWRDVYGGYVAGVGVNAILPGRGGDLLRLYIVKHRVDGSTYPTLASTMVADGIFDLFAAGLLLAWALYEGILPGTSVLPSLPGTDWLWVFRNPWQSIVIAGFFLAIALIVLGMYFPHITAFWDRVRQGLTILRTPRKYLRYVALWDALDWLLRLASIFFFLEAFGLPATVHNALAYQVAGSLSTALPLTPAGIGTEQALLVYIFSGTAPTSDILAFSVGVKLITVAINVALGVTAIAVMLGSVRWKHRVEADAAGRV